MFLRNSQTYSHPLRLVDHLSLFHRPHSLTQVTKAPTHSTNPSQALVYMDSVGQLVGGLSTA